MSHAQKGSGYASKVYFRKRYTVPFYMRRMPRNRDVRGSGSADVRGSCRAYTHGVRTAKIPLASL